MNRIRLIYALMIGLALYGCGEGSEVNDAADENDAAEKDGGTDLDASDGERCEGVTCPDDGNACTMNRCNAASGECETIPLSDVSCDDGLFCNGNDFCVDGECTHSGDPCGGGDTCVEEHQACGCTAASDCPDDPWGDWSDCDCDNPGNDCEDEGVRTRTRPVYTCEDALCVATAASETDTEACSCDTDGLECDVKGPIIIELCTWGTCAGGGCVPNICPAELAACDNDAKRCVECISDTYCGGATPRCNLDTNECVACSADADCSAADKPYCDTAVGECVECLMSSHCGDDEGCCTTGPNKYICRPTNTLCNPISPITSGPTVIPVVSSPVGLPPLSSP